MKEFIKEKFFRHFLIWRLWLFLPLIIGYYFLPFRPDSLFTTIWQYVPKYNFVENFLVYPWSNFDGVHYLAIASRGYIDEGRFLPLFPLLVRAVASPFSLIWEIKPYGQLVFWSGLILSNSFFVTSLYFLKKLLRLDFSEKFTNKVLLLLMVFPTSFFFVSVYSESLFLLLSVLSLYFARQKRWAWAVLFGSLLSITRLTGFLIIIPLVIEYLIGSQKSFVIGVVDVLRKNFGKLVKSFGFLIILLPVVVYSIYNNYKWSDYLYFVNAHAALGNSREVGGLVFPLVTVYRYLKIFLTVSVRQYEFWVAAVEFFSLIFVTFAIVFSYLKKTRPSYLIYSVALISVPLLSGTLTGFPRYILLAFPVFIGLVKVIEKNKLVWNVVLGTSLLLQFIFLMLFSRGWFIA